MKEIKLTETELQAVLKSAVKVTVIQVLNAMVSEGLISKNGAVYNKIAKEYGV